MNYLKGNRDFQAASEAVNRSRLLDTIRKNEDQHLRQESSAWPRSCFIGPSLVVACLVGTGGLKTMDVVLARTANTAAINDLKTPEAVIRQRRTVHPAAKLGRIKSFFKLSMTELALLMGVTRQAIYNWQGGQQVASQNADRLEQFSRAADSLEAVGLVITRQSLTRKISGNKTFFQALTAERNVDSVVEQFVNLMSSEEHQHALIAKRTKTNFVSRDIGIPYFPDEAT